MLMWSSGADDFAEFPDTATSRSFNRANITVACTNLLHAKKLTVLNCPDTQNQKLNRRVTKKGCG